MKKLPILVTEAALEVVNQTGTFPHLQYTWNFLILSDVPEEIVLYTWNFYSY